MTNRKPIVVGNWKLNHFIADGLTLVDELARRLDRISAVEIGVAPVSVSLHAVAQRLTDSPIFVAAQNCHWETAGAWTGEVSPPFLADAGCSACIVGHSERRQHFGDTDGGVGRKAAAVLATGMTAIICCGETEAERDAGQTFSRIDAQLEGALAPIGAELLDRVVLAYEPVWAIGTGKTASPAQAQEVHAHIRAQLGRRYGAAAQGVRIQYGGSVKPENAKELMAQADIDGALVGGASLKAEPFAAIVEAAIP